MKTESNLILLDFMGVAPKWNTWSKKWVYTDGFFCHISNTDREKVRYSMAEYAKYSTSWDWLMPVVEKILNICQESDEMEEYYIITDAIPEIESVFAACVEFAKWYKNQAMKKISNKIMRR